MGLSWFPPTRIFTDLCGGAAITSLSATIASSFAANMAVKQNALDFAMEYPLASKAVKENFYVNDGLTGADTVEEAVDLQK